MQLDNTKTENEISGRFKYFMAYPVNKNMPAVY
jgi:hypothetical protein